MIKHRVLLQKVDSKLLYIGTESIIDLGDEYIRFTIENVKNANALFDKYLPADRLDAFAHGRRPADRPLCKAQINDH